MRNVITSTIGTLSSPSLEQIDPENDNSESYWTYHSFFLTIYKKMHHRGRREIAEGIKNGKNVSFLGSETFLEFSWRNSALTEILYKMVSK